MTSGANARRFGGEDRILLIAYHFPPSAAVGGLRIANFARCLRAYGWVPHVLTIRERDIVQIDRSRDLGLDGIAVHHAAVWPTLERLYESVIRRVRRRSQPSAEATPTVSANAAATRAPSEGLVRRLKRYVLSFLVLPDRERGWVPNAVATAIAQIREHRIGWIMTSCPPYSAHVVGLAVKHLRRVKWIADFRDPWMTTGSKRLFPTSALSLKIERWLERRVIENADLVVFNVERLRNAYRDRYRNVPADKLVFIPNAVSSVAVRERPPVAKYDTFTLTYTGSLYLGRSPEPVFRALARLVEEGALEPNGARLVLVGQCDTIDGVPTREVARSYGLGGMVEVRGVVPYETAMEIVSRSHLALLFAPDLPFQIPAKVYDYLATGTRILAIADDGGTADLVRETESGRAFSTHDVAGIADYIRGELTRGRSAEYRTATLARFDIETITAELVGYMGRVGAMAEAAS